MRTVSLKPWRMAGVPPPRLCGWLVAAEAACAWQSAEEWGVQKGETPLPGV